MLLSIKAQTIKEIPVTMFTEIQTDARSAAMGGVSTLSEASAFGVFNNASANLFSTGKAAIGTSVSAQKDFSGNNLFSVGSFYNIDDKNGLSLGVRYFGYPTSYLMDENENGANSYKPKEMTLDLAYGRMLTENLSAAITLRYVHSDMGTFMETKKAGAFAADLGFTYASPMANFDGGNWSVALCASNFGTKIKYSDKEYTMPASIKAGNALYFPISENHKLATAINLGFRVLPSNYKGYECGIGAEYNLYRYAFLRAGYHLSDQENGTGNFITTGAGIELKPIKLDFSYWVGAPNQEYKNTLFISLSANF